MDTRGEGGPGARWSYPSPSLALALTLPLLPAPAEQAEELQGLVDWAMVEELILQPPPPDAVTNPAKASWLQARTTLALALIPASTAAPRPGSSHLLRSRSISPDVRC